MGSRRPADRGTLHVLQFLKKEKGSKDGLSLPLGDVGTGTPNFFFEKFPVSEST